jgi:hypothetical protein
MNVRCISDQKENAPDSAIWLTTLTLEKKKAISNNFTACGFTDLSMFYWAFCLPLLTAVYRSCQYCVRFLWCTYHGFLHHMHHGYGPQSTATLTLESDASVQNNAFAPCRRCTSGVSASGIHRSASRLAARG